MSCGEMSPLTLMRPVRAVFPQALSVLCILLMTTTSPVSAEPPRASSAVPSRVTLQRSAGGQWQLLRDGRPFVINGAGGQQHLDLLVAIGGNSFRTWGADDLDQKGADGKTLMERARERNLAVTVGIWLQHERHGFNYSDPAQLAKQREYVRGLVRRYRNDPALLIWGLGNEMEGPTADGRDNRIWKELQVLAKIVKEEDPHHPVMTVIAGAGKAKVQTLMQHYTEIDILGVNAYGSAPGVGKALQEAGWQKPFVLAEFGPVGAWEVRHTSWNAPVEQSSQEKAANYYSTHKLVMDDSKGTCIGSYAFVWGQKQETTATWYGMFAPTGEKMPSVDAMGYAWTGKWPDNRSPRIRKFETNLREAIVKPGEPFTAVLEATDVNQDTLKVEWTVVAESTDRREGGDDEEVPPSIPGCITRSEGMTAAGVAPKKPGAYRLFAAVRDGKGGASIDNVPFLVK